MLPSPPSFLHSGLCSRVAAPLNGLLRHREALHLSAEYDALPHHGSHEDSGGHALCLARTQKHTKRVQYSSQVGCCSALTPPGGSEHRTSSIPSFAEF